MEHWATIDLGTECCIIVFKGNTKDVNKRQ